MAKKFSGSADKVWAVLIAQRLQLSETEVDPLHPIGTDLPFALTPICNVPLIDYVLESLVLNGVDQTFVLHHDDSGIVESHLKTVRSMRGKSWVDSREMKVIAVKSQRPLTKLHDAATEIITRNLIPETKSVVWVPIDALTNFTGLREMVVRHNQRVDVSGRYAATMITVPDALPLHQAFEAASRPFVKESLERASKATLKRDSMGNTIPAATKLNMSPPMQDGSTLFDSSMEQTAECHLSDVHRMTVVHDHEGLLSQLHRHEADAGETTTAADETQFHISFSKKARLSVRTDLVFFGWCILSPGALGLIKFYMKDMFDLLLSIIHNFEIEQNVLGLDIAPPNTAYCTMHTLPGFLQTNMDVMSRVLFPLTRESNFADLHSHYMVSHNASSVYVARVHTEDITGLSPSDTAMSHRSLGPYAVIGPGVVVPSSTTVTKSVIGKQVQIGEHCVIERCVIMDDVKIMSHCVLRDTVVGAYSCVGAHTQLVGCVIGSGVTLDEDADDGSKRLCLENQRIQHERNEPSEPLLVGSRGLGHSSGPVRSHTVLPMTRLFTNDPVPALSDDESEEEEPIDMQFLKALTEVVELSIRSPSRMENAKIEMKNLRTSFHRTNGDLAKAVVQILLDYVQRHHATNAEDAYQRTFTMLQQWCKPFFYEFVTQQEDMIKVLEGVCLVLGAPGSILFSQAPRIFESLYNSCDDDLYDEREFCIVSGKSLLAFDDYVGELEEAEGAEDAEMDEEEQAVLKVGRICATFVAGVDKFLNEA